MGSLTGSWEVLADPLEVLGRPFVILGGSLGVLLASLGGPGGSSGRSRGSLGRNHKESRTQKVLLECLGRALACPWGDFGRLG